MAAGPHLTDGVVTIRPPTADDVAVLLAGRDEESRRFIGDVDPAPRPTACIVVGDRVIGWVDFDDDRAWLGPGEVNVGYCVFPAFRGHGYATRGVKLLLRHLAEAGTSSVATLLIHPDNAPSLALARRLDFTPHGELDGNRYWKTDVARFALQSSGPCSSTA